jgi:hypothetical protein
MKISLLTQLKVWFGLDHGKASLVNDREKLESKEFRHQATELDRLLKAAPPPFQAPEGLHEHIMARVRASSRPAPAVGSRSWQWGFGAATTMVIIVAIGWVAHTQLDERDSLSNPVTVAPSLSSADFVPAVQLASTVLAPLTEEMDRVNQDVVGVADRLLASFP